MLDQPLARPPFRVAAPVRARVPAFAHAVAREGLTVALLGACVVFWSVAATSLFGNDSWMTIAWGREIAAHGIPYHDTLTVMTHGDRWVDQQWLAQLAFWKIFALGGIRLALAATIALLLVPVAISVGVARRRGASTIAIAPFALLPLLDVSSILRAQLFSQLLFPVLLALLARESRAPSRRVLLAFPLLVLWANLHGAVLVGAFLVAALGVHDLTHRRLRRGVLLALAPWPCLAATPYGLATLGYYHGTIGNPLLRAIETEWRAPVPASVMGFAVYALAAAAVALVARRPRDLTRFEAAALATTLGFALLAVRSAPWFAYACLALLPPLAEREFRRRPQPAETLLAPGVAAAAAGALAAAVAATFAVAAPTERLTTLWPKPAAHAVAHVLAADPDARVFASYEYPDWLLLDVPAARGRVAYDGRFETLSHDQLKAVMDYLWQTGGRGAAAQGYRLVVVNPHLEHDLLATLAAEPRARVLYRGADIIVVDRGRRAD